MRGIIQTSNTRFFLLQIDYLSLIIRLTIVCSTPTFFSHKQTNPYPVHFKAADYNPNLFVVCFIHIYFKCKIYKQ
jgi:hypothetical protein